MGLWECVGGLDEPWGSVGGRSLDRVSGCGRCRWEERERESRVVCGSRHTVGGWVGCGAGCGYVCGRMRLVLWEWGGCEGVEMTVG